MARRGFIGRFVDRVRDIIAPSPPPRREPPREEPPREREPRGTYRGIWREQRGQGSYRKNLDVFHRMVDDIEPNEADRIELWESFVRNINRNRKSDRYSRKNTLNPFWQDTGIAPDTMDWAKWRVAMGYTGKRRSRS